ncbi:MAG: MaoC family dehydratase [Armatimonadota bacterium]|nr:MaoC family dehydratase [Armatimonadota bacterium]MDR7519511.1 MaoC family dehydratase [Armatimonadota bacterium]MDR7550198.1 MaoC family dehydratase [Armatimonadota bacterium]
MAGWALGKTVDELAVGDRASITKIVTETDIHLYVGMTGDLNPLYVDEAYAAQTRYRGRIAPGILTAGQVIAVISTRLPGPGTILEQQEFRFTAPVRPGDALTAFVEVVEVLPSRGRARLRTVCKNQDGVVVLDGEVVVLPPPRVHTGPGGVGERR